MNGQNKARAYDLETGKELWTCGGQTERPCATPVASNGLVYVGSGHRGSFLGAFKLDGKGDISKTKSVAWTVRPTLLLQGQIGAVELYRCGQW
jgi:outer membrane protein assembly factor BamB